MDRSPALEGKDGGRGSGSWPRTPRFAVGDEVEVLFTGSGFRGARFEATVTARFPDSRRYEVVYSELIVRRDGPPLREVVGVSELRPRPPPPQPGRDRASSSCLTSSRRTTTTDGGRASCPTSGPSGGGTKRNDSPCRSRCSARYWSSRPRSCGPGGSSCTEAG